MDTRKRRKEGNSGPSLIVESLHSLPKRAKVHAQRKFAQGSQPNSPALTPVKELRDRSIPTECRAKLGLTTPNTTLPIQQPSITQPLIQHPIRPKTEDFLTFLCFRRTALLPPELEFFETPQLLESSNSIEPRGLTPPQEEKVAKQSLSKKKEESQDEKKILPLPKESFKGNFEQMERETQDFISLPRVTRSSASLTPTPSFLSSPPSSEYSPQENKPKRRLTRKQRLLKKAMLIKSKNLKAQRRAQVHMNSEREKRRKAIALKDSAANLTILTRNKALKTAKFLSLRKKDQISRVLKRLGASTILPSEDTGRVTRSQIESGEDAATGAQKQEEVEEFARESRKKRTEPAEVPPPSASSRERRLMREATVSDEPRKPIRKENDVQKTESENSLRLTERLSNRRDFKIFKGLATKKGLRDKKLANIDRRVTRRLLYAREKKEESPEPSSDSPEPNLRARNTRSASDSISSGQSDQQTDEKSPASLPERSKSCEERSSDTTRRSFRNKPQESLPGPQNAEQPSSSLRARPSRKTKQVAEVYLELLSQRMVKEAQKDEDLSDDDMKEDTISISSIKELKAITRSPKNKEIDIEKCMQEIAERHEREIREAQPQDARQSRARTLVGKKIKLGKNPAPDNAKRKVNGLKEVTKRELRSRSSSAASEEAETSKEKNKVQNISPSRKHRTYSPKGAESPSKTTEAELVLPEKGKESRSPRGTRTVLQIPTSPTRPKSPRHATLVHNERSIRTSKSPHPPHQSPLIKSSSLKNTSHSPPIPSPELPTKSSPPEGKSLRKRALSEIPKTCKKEIVRRLSYDAKPKKEEVVSEPLETEPMPHFNLRKRESEKDAKASSVSKKEIEAKELEEKEVVLPTSPTSRKKCGDCSSSNYKESISSPSVKLPAKVKEGESSDMVTTKCEIETEAPSSSVTEEMDLPAPCVVPVKETEKRKATSLEPSKEPPLSNKVSAKPKRLMIPKCLPLSSRSKRTLSLDSEQNSLSQKSVRLKRKFGSLESVVNSSNKNENMLGTSAQSSSQIASLSYSKASTLREMKQRLTESTASSAQFKKSNHFRRRNSIHDEAKLNAVLESVAKDFEKDMDDNLYDKIEKDLNSGNKSPDKGNQTFLDSLNSKDETQEEKEEGSVLEESNSRGSPVCQFSSASSSPVTLRKGGTGKKLCDVVRNLQERKQAESPLSYTDSDEAPPFLQDLKARDGRNIEKLKQVSEEAIVMPPFDLAPAPSLPPSHSVDHSEPLPHITLKQSAHPCTPDQSTEEVAALKSIVCSSSISESAANTPNNESAASTSSSEPAASTSSSEPAASTSSSEPAAVTPFSESTTGTPFSESITGIPLNESTASTPKVFVENEVSISLPAVSCSVLPPVDPKPVSSAKPNNADGINETSGDATTFIPVSPFKSEPIPNVSTSTVINTKSLPSKKVSASIEVASNQLHPTTAMPLRGAHLGHGVTLPPMVIPPNSTSITETIKVTKGDQIMTKNSSKQILIAPKPTRMPNANSNQSICPLKNLPKPIQIAPKLPGKTASNATPAVGQLHSSTPILPASQMGHVIQGMPQVQTVHPLPQGLQTVQTIPPGVQPLQAITQNFPTMAGVTPAMQAVITQTMPINQSQLVTPSSPAKIITQPVFVTSSMPNIVGAPFDINMQNHLHSNVGTVARVVAQNVVGKVATKPQASLVSSGAQSLVTLAPGSIETSVMPPIVPFHQPLQPGQPAQFVAVNMMPVATSQIPLQRNRQLPSSQIGPIICPPTIACMAPSSGGSCSIPSMTTPLGLIPPGSIVTCPIPDVNTGMCNANLLQPIQCLPATTQTSQSETNALAISSSLQTQVDINSEVVASATDQSNLSEVPKCSLTLESTNLNRSTTTDQSGHSFGSSCHKVLSPSSSSLNTPNETPISCGENQFSASVPRENLPTHRTSSNETSESTLLAVATSSQDQTISSIPLERNKGLSSADTNDFKSDAIVCSNLSSSPAVSQSLSNPLLGTFPTSSTSNLTSSYTTVSSVVTLIDTPLELPVTSSTVVTAPITSFSSNMILSNLVFTTTSIVIPKMSDQSMTSPKAVTKVSQSSPPYVLSTSTSNDIPVKPIAEMSVSSCRASSSSQLSSANNNLGRILTPSVSHSSPLGEKEESSHKSSIKGSCRLPLKSSDGGNSTLSSIVSQTLASIASSSVTFTISSSQVKTTVTESKYDGSWNAFEPKTFYSNNSQRIYTKESPKTDLQRSINSIESRTTLDVLSSPSLTVTRKNVPIASSTKESTTAKPLGKPVKQTIMKSKTAPISSKIFKKSSSVLSNALHVNGKEFNKDKEVEKKFDKKREPILKKTLFKTKNLECTKPSGAFSPLNESSVYAFEPDLETPLEMTSRFSQRIKNIHPSPNKLNAPLAPSRIPSIPANELQKCNKAIKNRKPTFGSSKSDHFKKFLNKSGREGSVSVTQPVPKPSPNPFTSLPSTPTLSSFKPLSGTPNSTPTSKSLPSTSKPVSFVPCSPDSHSSLASIPKPVSCLPSSPHISSSNPLSPPHYIQPTSSDHLSPLSVQSVFTPKPTSSLPSSHVSTSKSLSSPPLTHSVSNLKPLSSPPLAQSVASLTPFSSPLPTHFVSTLRPLSSPPPTQPVSSLKPLSSPPLTQSVSSLKPLSSPPPTQPVSSLKHLSSPPTQPVSSLKPLSSPPHTQPVSSLKPLSSPPPPHPVSNYKLLSSPPKSLSSLPPSQHITSRTLSSQPATVPGPVAFTTKLPPNINSTIISVPTPAKPIRPVPFAGSTSHPFKPSTSEPSSALSLRDTTNKPALGVGDSKPGPTTRTLSLVKENPPARSESPSSFTAMVPKFRESENRSTELTIPDVKLKEVDSESNDSEELEIEAVTTTKLPSKPTTSSTSIAIQCDLDDSQSEKSQDELRGNENGTQTEGPSKFPLPPSASPFYYLPLAMATLGEKLPAQLVQQMLAKTQGLVGAAEAGLILQQAAQLAQQYHKTSDEDEVPSLPPSPVVKPISPKSGSIALQKALRANLASIAQAEISVAQSSGIQLPQSSSNTQPVQSKDVKISHPLLETPLKGLLKIAPASPEPPSLLENTKSNAKKTSDKVSKPVEKHSKTPEKVAKSSEKIGKCVDKVSKSNQDIINEAVNKVDKPGITQENPPSSSKITPKSCSAVAIPDPKMKRSKVIDVVVKRRSGRSSTLAATKATESDLQEVEEMRRHRRAKRAAAVLAKEESWSSSSEAPLSPIMSPDILRGWPPPRLTSPTPSQSSDGTTASSSTVSHRSRVSAPHSRRQSPAGSADSNRRPGRYSGGSSSNPFPADPVIEPGRLRICENPKLSRAPSFFPSEEEFTDPLDYIEKIRPEAEQFGLCRIVPPSNFRPECRVNDDMRFTAYKQYIHRMMRRWGPNDRALCAIKKCLAKQNIELSSNPLIGGLELDLVQLYKVVEKHGGLMKVIESELWGKVADDLRIPKSAQDRLSKLDSIYCKYLLPYTTLSEGERKNLLDEVDAIHLRTQSEEALRKSSSNEGSDNEEEEEEEPLECIVKGKSTALSSFYRIARNVACQWQPDPSGLELDERYWEVVREGDNYICVHTASIDTSEHGYGFPCQKSSSNNKHPWNLKNLCQNPNSVLRSMGNVIGVTAPTLHIGMMFSTVCWYKDPHSLPWIEYLHTGASKIWYGVSSSHEESFRAALKKVVPDFIKDFPLWLPSDTAMVPPEDLVENGVKVCRVVQEPGQFVVVFPGAFTSSICSGYLISESAFFARPQYFERACTSFKTMVECCEPSMFSLDRLAISVASDAKATFESLTRARQVLVEILEREKNERQTLLQLGLVNTERLVISDSCRKRRSRYAEEEEENCCEVCRQHLYVSLVTISPEETVYCLQHAIALISSEGFQLDSCKLMYAYSLPELTSLLSQVDDRIQQKVSKKSSSGVGKRGKFLEQESFSSTSGSNF